MVRLELWVTLLAYNLIRKVMATAAAVHDKQARRLSFTFTPTLHTATLANAECRIANSENAASEGGWQTTRVVRSGRTAPGRRKQDDDQANRGPEARFSATIGFTCQTVLSSWMLLATGSILDPQRLWAVTLERIAEREVPFRPGRIEPRAIKRRKDRYPYLHEPREKLRAASRKT